MPAAAHTPTAVTPNATTIEWSHVVVLVMITVLVLHTQVHAEGEAEHAALGHAAVAGFVPALHAGLLRRAMRDHR